MLTVTAFSGCLFPHPLFSAGRGQDDARDPIPAKCAAGTLYWLGKGK